MKLHTIYDRFSQTRLLRQHQTRVAGVAYLIRQELVEVDPDVVKALAVHDLGNIVRLKLELFPEDNEPQGLEYWQQIQAEYIKKYGVTDHIATDRMLEEIGITSKIRDLLNKMDWYRIPEYCKARDLEQMIQIYADMRVAPLGVVSIKERIDELNKRKGHWPEYEKSWEYGQLLEQEIFKNLKLKPEDINEVSVSAVIPKLEELDID